METANSLQEKNVVSPLRKFHQTEQIQTYTQVSTPTLCCGIKCLFWSYCYTCCPFPHSATKGLSFILEQTCGYVVSWLKRTLEREEESSNQYSRPDTTHCQHCTTADVSIMGLKWFDKNSVTFKRKGKFLGLSEKYLSLPETALEIMWKRLFSWS